MTVGIARKDKIFLSAAAGIGNPVVYVGSKTGRDGIHGATMASAEFAADSEDKRPTVQVGDPFTEKLLIEACLELMATDAIVAIQDMGAAGLTSSSVEMAGKGDVGIELDLDHVPARETGMTAYEFMLSESQERMLMVLRPDREQLARDIFHEMGPGLSPSSAGSPTPAASSSAITASVEADIPLAPLNDQAPLYTRPTVDTREIGKAEPGADRGPLRPDPCPGETGGLPRPVLARLGLGPVRQHRRRPDRKAARRRRCRRGEAGGPETRAGADHRLHPSVLPGRPGNRRRPGRRRSLAQPDRGRRPPAGHHRQHEFRQSGKARDHGPVRRRHPRHGRRLRGAGLPRRLRQRQPLQ